MPDDEIINPQPTIKFFLKNLGTIFRMMRSNTEKVIDFIGSNSRLESAIIPDFEGFGGPMDEGMIYIMFNSDGKPDPATIDSVFRVFWVSAPDLNYHQIDAYLVSSRYDNRHWNKIYREVSFLNKSKNDYHVELSTDQIDLNMHGNWESGYVFKFRDKISEISGDLEYRPLGRESTLVYYNGRAAIAPAAHQRFYDSFGLSITGELAIDRNQTSITGRGIIEHGIGIFGTSVFTGWKWINLQFEDGALHLFEHPIRIEDGPSVHAAEGAVWIDGQWYHLLKDDIQIDTTETEFSEELDMDIEAAWSVILTIGNGPKDLEARLDLSHLSKSSWRTDVTDEEVHEVTNYLLEFSGTINDTSIQGRGTMEILTIYLG